MLPWTQNVLFKTFFYYYMFLFVFIVGFPPTPNGQEPMLLLNASIVYAVSLAIIKFSSQDWKVMMKGKLSPLTLREYFSPFL